MAQISNLTLDLLAHNHPLETATFRLEYDVVFTDTEAGMTDLSWLERIRLFGEDLGTDRELWERAQRDSLTTGSAIPGDGQECQSAWTSVGANTWHRCIAIGPMSDDILDEDRFGFGPRGGPRDEVYGRVQITPELDPAAQPRADAESSNVIRHEFHT